MKIEMTGSIAGRQRDGSGIVWGESPRALVEFPNEDAVQGEVRVNDEAARGVGRDHVSVRHIVSADGETAWRCVGRFPRADVTGVFFDIGRGTQSAIRQDR